MSGLVDGIIPPAGAFVYCWFGANKYPGKVVRLNRNGKPVVRFTLKNGKVKEGRATVVEKDAAQVHQYRGYLAQMRETIEACTKRLEEIADLDAQIDQAAEDNPVTKTLL